MRVSCVSSSLLILLVLGACASERQVKWGEETAVERETIVKEASSDAPVTAAAYAAKFTTDGECESEARRIADKSPDLALRLLKACVARGDFRRLTGVVDAPWTTTLARSSDGPNICARVVAARASDIEADVKACAKAGFPVFTLADVFDEPGKAKGRLVIFRGRTDPDLSDKTRTRLVETALEQGELDTVSTGRRVAANFGSVKVPKTDGVFLSRAVKVDDDTVANDGEVLAVVDIQASFKPAAAPTF